MCDEGVDEHHAQDAQQVAHVALHRLDIHGHELGEAEQLRKAPRRGVGMRSSAVWRGGAVVRWFGGAEVEVEMWS
jgi:hypothetical protein